MSKSPLSVALAGWGTSCLSLDEIAGLRRTIPSWAPTDTANHFFKYADEQTLTAVRAVDDLFAGGTLSPSDCVGWNVIAAPCFLGRRIVAHSIDQFERGGARTVSPHVIPQNSLHSVSGALSILLATNGANVGLGGGRDSLIDGLMAAISLFEDSAATGCWMVATQWDPEPLPDTRGTWVTTGHCHAVALALRPALTGETTGDGVLSLENSPVQRLTSETTNSVSHLAKQLRASVSGQKFSIDWPLPWGAILRLRLPAETARLRRAA